MLPDILTFAKPPATLRILAIACVLLSAATAWPQETEPAKAVPEDVAAESAEAPVAEELPPAGTWQRFEKRIDVWASAVSEKIAAVLFFDLSSLFLDTKDGEELWGLQVVVVYLVAAAVFFTFWTKFLNLRAMKHGFLIVAGKYDDPNDLGEVTHFQALSAALSATIGLGNIAGVAIAVGIGGPGAIFWMVVMGFLAMSSKFMECTLGMKYRGVRPDGRIMGGAMYYLSKGLKEIGLGPLGMVLAPLFALLCVVASFGGGNAFQVNQSMQAVNEQIPFLETNKWVYGVVMAFLVGLVILGGIRRIAHVAEKIVPFMCVLYVGACLVVLGKNFEAIPTAFTLIISEAFSPSAAYGGFVFVLMWGVKRAVFSNEAGLGSAPIAHSAAKTDYPVREGIVGLIAPFIDTVIVCTMTGLVIVITGIYANPDPQIQTFIAKNQGAALTAAAFGQEVNWFPEVLSLAVFLFAYSTIISWSYYGERCWAYLFGDRSTIIYRILYLACTFLGAIVSATNVLVLSTLLMLAMAVPNIIGLVLLAPKVSRDLDDYWRMYKNGEFDEPTQQPVPEKIS